MICRKNIFYIDLRISEMLARFLLRYECAPILCMSQQRVVDKCCRWKFSRSAKAIAQTMSWHSARVARCNPSGYLPINHGSIARLRESWCLVWLQIRILDF